MSNRLSSWIPAFVALISVAASHAGQAPKGDGSFKWEWQHSRELTWKESITKRKNLSAIEKGRLAEAIAEQLRPSMADLDIGSEKQLLEVAAGTAIEFLSFGKGEKLVIAQGGGAKAGCSPTGNCPFWVFQASEGKYLVLLEGQAQTFTIQSAKTNGLPDFVLGLHMSASQQELTEFKFDGKKYVSASCHMADWTYLDERDEVQELKEPRLGSCRIGIGLRQREQKG